MRAYTYIIMYIINFISQEGNLYNYEEVELNERLHNFAEHCAEYLKGQNNIKGQLGLAIKHADITRK